MYYKKGDNKMKKRTISLFMSLVMMALLCYPAFARTSLGDVEFLTPTSLDEFTVDVFPKEDGFFAQETADKTLRKDQSQVAKIYLYDFVQCLQHN